MLVMSLFDSTEDIGLDTKQVSSTTATTAENTTTTSPTDSSTPELHTSDAITTAAEDYHLAKLYRLGEMDKEWQEFGFVRVHSAYVDSLVEHCLILIDTNTLQVSFEIPVSSVEYKRDAGTTIITWQDTLRTFTTREATSPCDVALSFETIEGCDKIWEAICVGQGKIVSSNFRASNGELMQDFTPSSPTSSSPRQQQQANHSDHYIVTRENLDQFVKKLYNSGALFKARFTSELTQPDNDYANFTRMLSIYNEITAEPDSTKRRHELVQMFELVKHVALLDDQLIFELMLCEDNFPLVAGSLENDPTLPFQAEHRKFLQAAKFHEICPISSDEVRAKIHFRFRLGFLRDVLLSRVLDEASFKKLNLMDNKVSCEIAVGLHQDDQFLPELFTLLLRPRTEEDRAKRTQAVALFAEFNTLVQKLGPMQKSDVYKTMFVEGDLFELILGILRDERSTTKEKLDFEDILQLAIKQDSILFQETMLLAEQVNEPQSSLMGILVNLAIHDDDCGVQAMACNLLETLLDPETHSSNTTTTTQLPLEHASTTDDDGSTENDLLDAIPFFGHFYSKHFLRLLTVLLPSEERRRRKGGSLENETLHLITSVVCFCIQTHGYVIRQVLATHQDKFALAIANLIRAKDKFLVLDGIRFARVLVGMKEKFYDEFVIEHRILDLVLERFTELGGLRVNNLIQSAVIDLFETIYSQNTGGNGNNITQLAHHAGMQIRNNVHVDKSFKTFAQLDALIKQEGDSGFPRPNNSRLMIDNEMIAMASPQNSNVTHTYALLGTDEVEAPFLGFGSSMLEKDAAVPKRRRFEEDDRG